VVAPHGTDFGAIASQTRDQAIAAGSDAAQQFVTTQILADQTVTRAVASAVVDGLTTPRKASPSKLTASKVSSSSKSPSADLPMQVSPATPFVFPRPRPASMG